MSAFIAIAWFVLSCTYQAVPTADVQDLEAGFARPPASARPWVYWFWLNGNITREGITADLEAMRRVGIGGVLIMEVDQGAPAGPVVFASPAWRELFRHVVSEADRLGLQVNMNNDAGWTGSGGPWITPDLAMQKVVWTETTVQGPTRLGPALAEPQRFANYYRDIAVLAFPTPGEYRIEGVAGKSALVRQEVIPQSTYPELPAGQVVESQAILDLTSRMRPNGTLDWDVPEGQWTILRIGHTTTGAINLPAPAAAQGLECDKMSKVAVETHFSALMGKLIADVGPLAGKTLVSTHIDSWEVGSQNWTPRFREEFLRLRGYDLLPYLPVVTGIVVDSLEVSERFLWDLRQTISDLIVENYAGHMAKLANDHGMRLSIEAYDGNPCDDMTYAGRADEPMAEFWSWPNNFTSYSCTQMASAAHVYGKRILGAEAFTATDGERWLHHPASIKALGDWAFCEGINRFVFHRYALQPWLDVQPGMSMGPWGLHYERTQTWWEQSAAWHRYLARCQYLLQQGLFVADICYLAPERSPQRFVVPRPHGTERPPYNFDGCTPEVVIERMQVRDGCLVLPDGMSYRLLVLPDVPTMTPRLLAKIGDLVRAGATVVGAPPLESPSLSGYPGCDDEVRRLAAEIWGDCDGQKVKERRYGKGKVVWGIAPERVLERMGVPADFSYHTLSGRSSLRYIHRALGDTQVYFVANKSAQSEDAVCTFRVSGMRPELWWPGSGEIEKLAVYDQRNGLTHLPLHLEATESVFVIFRPGQPVEQDRIVSVSLEGEVVLDARPKPRLRLDTDNNARITNNFTMAAWVRPDAPTGLPQEADSGAGGLGVVRNEVLYPPPGHEVYSDDGHAGAGFSVGTNGVCVYEHSADYFAPVLVYGQSISGWVHVVIVYRDACPSLYLNGRLVHTGLTSKHSVHPGVGVQHTRAVDPFRGDVGELQMFDRALSETEIARLAAETPIPKARPGTASIELRRVRGGQIEADVWQPGKYVLRTADGRKHIVEIGDLPAPLMLEGPWEVRFEAGIGAPESVTFDKLISWSIHDDPEIRYYSGAATYYKTFSIPQDLLAPDKRLLLELGRVEVIAEVRLNGRLLGTVWKPPYRVDVTGMARPGENTLEVKVANLWVNRMIGDENLPEDSRRHPDGRLVEWPQWLLDGSPSPTGRRTFSSWKLWRKDEPLQPSGLLGPVEVRAYARVELPAK
ncbi:MAG: glycosyl hydrolase family 43 [Fimbriimonadia bacterium]|jgi:hypothetical protein